ncbi:pilus assembly PilX family protein [Pseudomonas sp. LRF_L74]|uniref:pilus assembly PilX family protein n=1 Tax=Pseudomonas sp. LRF_L74 TaxID=3369422 RepID=UPI003F61E4D8
MRPDRQRGFGLVAAMFLIIIVAAAIVLMSRLNVTQSATASLAIQQARAYQSARAGLEWGINRALASQTCSGSFSLDGFTIGVTCAVTSAGAIAEENKTVTFSQITATAEYGAANTPDYAYRQLTTVVELP